MFKNIYKQVRRINVDKEVKEFEILEHGIKKDKCNDKEERDL